MMTNLQRRSVLRVLGLVGGGSLLPSLRPRSAQAATPPKRLFWFFSISGTLPQFWAPKSGTETDFVLGDLMLPFESYKKDLLILDNLDTKERDLPGHRGLGNGHQQAYNAILAGIDTSSSNFPGGPTIDQLVAKSNAGKTKFASVEMGINFNDGKYRADLPGYVAVAHPAAGQKLPIEADPKKLWSRIFAGFTPPGAGPAPVVDNSGKRQKSILDYVRGEVGSVAPRLSAADRAKLDAHASGIRDLELRLNLDGKGGGFGAGAGTGCVATAAPAVGTTLAAHTDIMVKLGAMMLACDLTRVVSMPYLPSEQPGASVYTGGAFGTSDYHDLVHKTSPLNGSLRTNPAAVEMVKKFQLESSMGIRKLLDAMSSMPDVDGKRLLDNSLVFLE